MQRKQKSTESPNALSKLVLFEASFLRVHAEDPVRGGDHRLKQMDVPSIATYVASGHSRDCQTTPLGGWHFQS